MLPPAVSLSWRKEAGSLQRRALPWGLQPGSLWGPCAMRACDFYHSLSHCSIVCGALGGHFSEPWGPRRMSWSWLMRCSMLMGKTDGVQVAMTV